MKFQLPIDISVRCYVCGEKLSAVFFDPEGYDFVLSVEHCKSCNPEKGENMSEVLKIVEDFLDGKNDAGGTIANLQEEAERLASQIEALENTRDAAHNAALEWAAEWITGAQLSGRGVEVQEYARSMAMSIRAAKRGLTPRSLDVCPSCAGKGTVKIGVYSETCSACHGAGTRQ